MFVFNIMCKLFFAIGLGYYLNKKGILTEDVNQHLSSFIIKIATPCLIISSVTSVSSIDQSFVIQLVIIGVAIYCMLPVVAYLLTIVFPCFQSKKHTYACMFMFSNCGFMALPIVQSIFGNDAIQHTILYAWQLSIIKRRRNNILIQTATALICWCCFILDCDSFILYTYTASRMHQRFSFLYWKCCNTTFHDIHWCFHCLLSNQRSHCK